MSTEPKIENDNKNVSHAGFMNWPSVFMLVLWLLVILGLSGVEMFAPLSSPVVLGIILIAAVFVTAWTIFRLLNAKGKNS